MRVSVSLETEDVDPQLRSWLTRQARRAAEAAGLHDGKLSVAVVSDVQMMQLHHQFSGECGTTDVLTFDLRDDSGQSLDGEIIVCIDEAKRQARVLGHPPRREALLYVVHGLMHLLGHDDHDPAAAQQMHQREDQVLTDIGVGPVFNPGRA